MNPKTKEAYELAQGLPDEEVLELIHRLLNLVSELKRRRQGSAARPSTQTPDAPVSVQGRSLKELHGLGKGVWQDVDIEKYIHELRGEMGAPMIRLDDCLRGVHRVALDTPSANLPNRSCS